MPSTNNSLQAVLDRAKNNNISQEKTEKVIRRKIKQSKTPQTKKTNSRTDTVLIGGHFHPTVLRQLRIIAAEEETTNQALIEEALNLLFAKKGKKIIGGKL